MDIYVGNLASTVAEHTLRQLREPYGLVNKARVMTERDTGRSQGFGCVDMAADQAAHAAIAGLQSQECAGRARVVHAAKPREPRPAPRQTRW